MEFRRPYENSSVTVPENGYDYIIYGEDLDGDGVADIIYAKNGRTGEVEFKGTDAASVIQGALDNVKQGGTVVISGNLTYEISSPISLDGLSYVHIIGNGRVTLKPISDISVFTKSASSSFTYSTIKNLSFTSSYSSPVINLTATTPYVVTKCTFENLYFFDVGTAFKIQSGTSAGEVYQNNFRNIFVYQARDYALYAPTYGINQSTFESFYVDLYSDNTVNNAVYLADSFNNWFGHLYLRGWLSLSNTRTRIDLLRFETVNSTQVSNNDSSLIYATGGVSIGMLVLQDISSTIQTLIKTAESAHISIQQLSAYGPVSYSYLVKSFNPPFYINIENFDIPAPLTSYITGTETYSTLSDALKSGYLSIQKTSLGLIKNSSTVTFTGDGSTTTFSVAHGLVAQPSKYFMQALNDLAKNYSTFSADATYLYVNFSSAPGSGSTLSYYWYAEV